jgi:hypothetical protein
VRRQPFIRVFSIVLFQFLAVAFSQEHSLSRHDPIKSLPLGTKIVFQFSEEADLRSLTFQGGQLVRDPRGGMAHGSVIAAIRPGVWEFTIRSISLAYRWFIVRPGVYEPGGWLQWYKSDSGDLCQPTQKEMEKFKEATEIDIVQLQITSRDGKTLFYNAPGRKVTDPATQTLLSEFGGLPEPTVQHLYETFGQHLRAITLPDVDTNAFDRIEDDKARSVSAREGEVLSEEERRTEKKALQRGRYSNSRVRDLIRRVLKR